MNIKDSKSPFHYSNYNFISEHPDEFSEKMIMHAEKTIERYIYQRKLFEIIDDKEMMFNIEKSIFEFALSFCLNNNLEYSFIKNVYDDKFYTIFNNINGNSKIKNNTLLDMITSNIIDPKYIAFMSPAELHPSVWKNHLERKKYKEQQENNISYSTAYKCTQCGESKSKVSQAQIRSADEPATTFIVCIVCGNTTKYND